MKTIFEHIERVKGQPHHIRKRVAFSTAAVGTAVIAFVWVVASLSTGAFALKDSSFAQNASDNGTQSVLNGSEQLAGVGAVSESSGENEPARIEIIDAPSPSSSGKEQEKTIIPF